MGGCGWRRLGGLAMSYSITVFRSSTGQSTQSPPERANVGESCRTLKLMILPEGKGLNKPGHVSVSPPHQQYKLCQYLENVVKSTHPRYFFKTELNKSDHVLTITSPSPPPPRRQEWTRHQGWRCRGPSIGGRREDRPQGAACKSITVLKFHRWVTREDKGKPFSVIG